jgi:hypothetical protein
MDTAVGLVKGYLELCGYFVLAELPVRAPSGGGYRDATDLDVVAVRFPHTPRQLQGSAARPLAVFLGSDPALITFDEGIDVVIGEVKEGDARLNPALRRAETVAFALRRLGCCPEERIDEEARALARRGHIDATMAGGLRCRLRLVAFAGRGRATEHGVHTVPLARCAAFIAGRLREGRDVLAGIQFKDPVLALFALQAKLGLSEGASDAENPRAASPGRPA